MQHIGPLQFRPVLKRIRWGGRRLGTALGKPIGDESDYAESWEVSCHDNGPSIVDGGAFDGVDFRELVARFPDDVLGPRRSSDRFPLLVKFLDANDRLSVQVHPNDDLAGEFEPGGNGKTEMWVILDAEPGSSLYVGLKAGVDEPRLRRSLQNETLEDCLHRVEVAAGDCVFIPAGTVHAIGEGILLAEIQQSSDVTFRLDDWGRVGADGKPRPLHIEQALRCIDFQRGPVEPVAPEVLNADEPRCERLVQSAYFTTHRYTAERSFALQKEASFRVLMLLKGAAEIATEGDRRKLQFGRTMLIPACCGDVHIAPQGEVVLLDVVPYGSQ